MDIQVAAVCDSAVDYSGKLCLLGVFDTIVAAQMPAVHPQCSVALRLIFRKEEEGPHTIVVQFGDEDGHPIVPPLETGLEVEAPGDFLFTARNLILNIQQLTFQKRGLYSVDISVDQRHVASIPLQVVQLSTV